MDEKFSVLFWTEFLVGELKFQVFGHLNVNFLPKINMEFFLYAVVDDVSSRGGYCAWESRAPSIGNYHLG